jgi:arginyl-tRNA synthetase
MCEFLLANGFAFEQDGALWFQSTKYGDDKDRVLRRSDGRYTYLASDIAYHKNKVDRGFTKLVNLWGADHHGYVPRMKAAMQALGKTPETLHIILYQLVSLVRNGAPVAMSTRAGEFVTLEEVIKEVGVDACRFFFMLRAPDSPLEFDLELAKKQSSENPVFYVQYVHARCCSIFKEYHSKNPGSELKAPDFSLLKTVEERDLVKKLAFFPDTLELCAKTYSPNYLTNYLMETADLFHKFYEKCRVITADKELTNTRLSFVKCIASGIKDGLSLLGVSAPERM